MTRPDRINRRPVEQRDLRRVDKRVKAGVDWELVEADYRAGALSIAEIARQRGISATRIRQRAGCEAWTRDLSRHVATAVRAALVRSPAGQLAQEKDAVAAAASAVVEVVRRHQRHMGKLAKFSEVMTEHMLLIAQGKKPAVEVLGPRETIADALQKIAVATARYIPLERKAWSIDAGEAGNDLVSWLQAQNDLD